MRFFVVVVVFEQVDRLKVMASGLVDEQRLAGPKVLSVSRADLRARTSADGFVPYTLARGPSWLLSFRADSFGGMIFKGIIRETGRPEVCSVLVPGASITLGKF